MKSSSWIALVVLLLSCTVSTPAQPTTPASQPIESNPWTQMHLETPENAALRLWGYEHGPAKFRCVEHIHNAQISIVDEGTLDKECGRTSIVGCMDSYNPDSGAKILLLNDPMGLAYDVLVHEYLHVLIWCHGNGEAEGNKHSDTVWRHVPISSLSKDSPWFRDKP